MEYKNNFKILSAMFMLVMGVALCFCVTKKRYKGTAF